MARMGACSSPLPAIFAALIPAPTSSMDRNSVIGFILIAAILVGYTWYTMPSSEEQARWQKEQDSIAALLIDEQDERRRVLDQEEAVAPTALAAVPDSLTDNEAADSLKLSGLVQRFGIFHPAATGETREVVLEDDRLQISFNTHGARPTVIRLKEYQTYHGEPLLLADPDSGAFEFRFFLGNRDIGTSDLHFEPQQLDARTLRFEAATSEPGKHIAITYHLDTASYFLHSTLEVVGLKQDLDPRKLFFHWDVAGLSNEKHRPNDLQKSGVYFKYFSDTRDYLSETSDDEKKLNGRTNWVAFKQDYFSVAMVSDAGFAGDGSELAIRELPGPRHTKAYSAKLYFDTPASDHAEIAMRLYLGPNHFGTLRRTEVEELTKVIDLGPSIFGMMNRWIVIPIFNFLDGFGLSYGIIILVLTLVIKLLLMPLTWKNYVSSAKMRALKPEMDAINEKHKDGDAMKKQQATMDLYRKAGVNPVSGCVPMLIQMPILFAMFRFFPSSIELRQQPFLWADDLSSYDSILDLPFEIPWYGDHVSLFTLLMAASTVVYTMINSKQMPTQQGMPSMKLMMYLFPVMMLFFLNNFSSGLSYYYLLANLISILQMTLFKHWFVNEDKIRAELLANMKKPRKKSRWQQRLEDLQKQQQQGQKRKR